MFRALLLEEKDGKVASRLAELDEDRLPAGEVTVEVQTSDGPTTTATADAMGRFRLELRDVARIRLRVVPEGRRPVETSWLAL